MIQLGVPYNRMYLQLAEYDLLIMETDEEDDNHFCMKCKTVIIGLENYIEHRKQKCSSQVIFLVSNRELCKILNKPMSVWYLCRLQLL